MFGDSFELIPKIIDEECCVLIDGPKDLLAVKLAVYLLKNPLVRAVFIHDIDLDSPHRRAVEEIFKWTFFTDDLDYVTAFKSLDEPCWSEGYEMWAPYRRGNRIRKSYASTLLAILNSEKCFDQKRYYEYLEKAENGRGSWSIKYFLNGWENRIRNIFKFPSQYIYYEKTMVRNKSISFLDFFKQWTRRILSNMRTAFRKRFSNYDEL